MEGLIIAYTKGCFGSMRDFKGLEVDWALWELEEILQQIWRESIIRLCIRHESYPSYRQIWTCTMASVEAVCFRQGVGMSHLSECGMR